MSNEQERGNTGSLWGCGHCVSSLQDRKATHTQRGDSLPAAMSQAQGLRFPENQLPRGGCCEMWTWTHLSNTHQQALPAPFCSPVESGHTRGGPLLPGLHYLTSSVSALFCWKKPREGPVTSPTGLLGRKAETNKPVHRGGKLLVAQRNISAIFPAGLKINDQCISNSNAPDSLLLAFRSHGLLSFLLELLGAPDKLIRLEESTFPLTVTLAPEAGLWDLVVSALLDPSVCPSCLLLGRQQVHVGGCSTFKQISDIVYFHTNTTWWILKLWTFSNIITMPLSLLTK